MEGRRQRGDRERDVIKLDLGLGNLFSGLGNLMDLVTQMSEEGETEVRREGEIKGPGKVKGVYGFSVQMGVGGKPLVERFGNVRETAQGPVVEDVREPLIDVFDEGDRVLVVAELPGVQDLTIQVQVEGDVLSLTAEGRDRKYAKEMVLPSSVDPAPIKRSCQNGILEIEFKKSQP